MKPAITALAFLTALQRLGKTPPEPHRIGAMAGCFPLTGLILGVALLLSDRLLQPHLDSEVLSAVLVLELALLTGGMSLDALRGTFARLPGSLSFGGSGTGETSGLLALFFVLMLKVRTIEVAGDSRSIDLLLAPVFGRWALVIYLYGAAAAAGEPLRSIAAGVRPLQLFLATAIALVLAVYLLGRGALWIGLVVSLATLLARSCFGKWAGAPSLDGAGGVVELAETLALLLLSVL
ncbi:MAG TPA: adenosylcobinamide-GDP ribazoletransferase [candidate division Zixibacteria bacterium]|nr:adenosylcobinamide-GDP ribazoletransferase [candidate division Zixibacteria bacterium]